MRIFGSSKPKTTAPVIGSPVVSRPGATQTATRTYEQRLTDFHPSLRTFLDRVWRARGNISLDSRDAGMNTIYGFYAGNAPDFKYNSKIMLDFWKRLNDVVDPYNVVTQDHPKVDLTDINVEVHGRDLWDEFFHTFNDTQDDTTTTRVYVNAPDDKHALKIFEKIIYHFQDDRRVWEAKIAGPGCNRLDRIVAYCNNKEAANQLVEVLKGYAREKPHYFGPTLPPLVVPAAPGIGTADEPPGIEIHDGQGDRHSYGGFHSTLCWIALRSIPNVRTSTEPRAFLDNYLYTLRLLRIDPMVPSSMPEKVALEQYYHTVISRQPK